MWFWQRRGRPEDNFGIAAGQRFRPVGSIPIIWEVESVARHPGEPVAHVRLHRVDVPSQGKTVALQVLRDKRYYQPAPRLPKAISGALPLCLFDALLTPW